MNFRCSLCDGKLQRQLDDDGTHRCLDCGAGHLFDKGFLLSERWVKTEMKRLRRLIQRVHEVCDNHIQGRASMGRNACFDCAVWTLRSEAEKLKGG